MPCPFPMHENNADIGFSGLSVGRQNQKQSNNGNQKPIKRMHCILQRKLPDPLPLIGKETWEKMFACRLRGL